MKNIFGTTAPQVDFDKLVSKIDKSWLSEPRNMSIFDAPTLHNDVVSAIIHAKVFHQANLAAGLRKNLSLVAEKWEIDDSQVQALYNRLTEKEHA